MLQDAAGEMMIYLTETESVKDLKQEKIQIDSRTRFRGLNFIQSEFHLEA